MENWIKLANPFRTVENYNCFGCSPDNAQGLQLDFYDTGESLVAEWMPDHTFEGWIGVLHGGVQATLVDEVASWLVFVRLKTAGVTSRMELRYRKPVFVHDGRVRVTATLIEVQKNIASISVVLINGNDEKCLDGIVHYYVFSEEIARQKYQYPGVEAFYLVQGEGL